MNKRKLFKKISIAIVFFVSLLIIYNRLSNPKQIDKETNIVKLSSALSKEQVILINNQVYINNSGIILNSEFEDNLVLVASELNALERSDFLFHEYYYKELGSLNLSFNTSLYKYNDNYYIYSDEDYYTLLVKKEDAKFKSIEQFIDKDVTLSFLIGNDTPTSYLLNTERPFTSIKKVSNLDFTITDLMSYMNIFINEKGKDYSYIFLGKGFEEGNYFYVTDQEGDFYEVFINHMYLIKK